MTSRTTASVSFTGLGLLRTWGRVPPVLPGLQTHAVPPVHLPQNFTRLDTSLKFFEDNRDFFRLIADRGRRRGTLITPKRHVLVQDHCQGRCRHDGYRSNYLLLRCLWMLS